MTPRELGWVAGILEGEGCFSITTRTKGHSRAPRIQVPSTDEDVIRRLHRVTGVGIVHGPVIDPRGDRKPVWRWLVQKKSDALELMQMIYPLMGVRRQTSIRESLDLFT